MSIFWDTLMGCWGSLPVMSEPPPTATVSISLNKNAYCNKGVQYSTDTLSVTYDVSPPYATGYVAKMYVNGTYNRNLSFYSSGLTLSLPGVASSTYHATGVSYQLRIDIVAATGSVIGSYYSNTVSYNSGTCAP